MTITISHSHKKKSTSQFLFSTRTFRYPLKYIQSFKEDLLPFNSDVLLVLPQYLSRRENLRADNIEPGGLHLEKWFWIVDTNSAHIQTAPPKKIKS